MEIYRKQVAYMDLQILKTFLSVAQTENITQTAEKMNFSQPTVTAQIKNLEEDFGVLLFERVGKKLYITEAGKCLIPYAEKILAAYREAQVSLAGFSYDKTIRIGLGTAVAAYTLASVLHRFQKKMAEVSVHIEHCFDIPMAVAGVLSNQFDFALVHDGVVHPRLLQFDVVVQKLCWCVHKSLYEAYGDALWQYPFVLLKEGSIYRNIYGSLFAEHQIRPVLEYSDSEAVKQAVLNGFGVGVLPEILVEEALAAGTLVEFTEAPALEITFSILLHKDKTITEPVLVLLQMLSELMPDAEKETSLYAYLQRSARQG